MWHAKPINPTIRYALLLTLLLGAVAFAQESRRLPCQPDKDLCALMIRYGNEAYDRGKYLEARKYFRMAIASDPLSAKAWALYDRSFLSHMAKQIEKTGQFNPYVETDDMEKMFQAVPHHVPATTPTPAVMPPAQVPTPQQPETSSPEETPAGVIIGDDEGC